MEKKRGIEDYHGIDIKIYRFKYDKYYGKM
jgi:hypothetical protein